MNGYVQSCFAFFVGGAPERIERDVDYALRHPELEAEIVKIMRAVITEGNVPSVHSAIVRLRERGFRFFDGAKAFYGRLIAAKYADLRPFIRTTSSELDRRD